MERLSSALLLVLSNVEMSRDERDVNGHRTRCSLWRTLRTGER